LLATSYSFAFKSRLFYSFLTVCVLFAFYEYSRQKSYRFSQEMSRKYENQARIDQLSQLLNRRGIREILEAEFARQQRYTGALSLVMCDIDHFKQVNDRHGHQEGDNVIKYLATIFKQALRKQDQTARWGGEEFLIVLPETDSEQALILAEKLRAQIHAHTFSTDSQTFQISASFGIYQVKTDDSIDQAVNRADQALYEAKEQGRNQCILSRHHTKQ
jgi:diguanylate cyclase (GGDEF)-like protein